MLGIVLLIGLAVIFYAICLIVKYNKSKFITLELDTDMSQLLIPTDDKSFLEITDIYNVISQYSYFVDINGKERFLNANNLFFVFKNNHDEPICNLSGIIYFICNGRMIKKDVLWSSMILNNEKLSLLCRCNDNVVRYGIPFDRNLLFRSIEITSLGCDTGCIYVDKFLLPKCGIQIKNKPLEYHECIKN